MVEVTIANALGSRRLSVRRSHVEVPSVDDVKIIDQEYGIGYLKLTCFQKTTSRDLDSALWKLHREGMKSLVIDLRGNPGRAAHLERRSGRQVHRRRRDRVDPGPQCRRGLQLIRVTKPARGGFRWCC